MAEVKWIKITTDMFDNRKIKHLRRLPEGNSIVLIWVMLLTMAGRCNASGMIFLTENIPYSPKMLADELGFEENTVKLALQALENFNMIVSNGNYFTISGWEEYQNTDRLSEIREYNRIAKQKSRAKQKALEAPADVNDKSMTSQRCHETDIDKEIELEKELERDIIDYSSIAEASVSYQKIIEMFHSICKSFPKVRSLSEARRKAIRARLKTYSVDDFKTVFQNAEDSSFLKGKNDRNWQANFDWLIADKNMAKVLEGQYGDRGKKEKLPDWFGRRELDEDEVAAINRMLSEPDDETEQLRRELQSLGGRQ